MLPLYEGRIILKKTTLRFKIVDIFYVTMMILPIAFCMVLNVLTEPPSEGITVTGARIFFTVPMPFQPFYVTEAQVNSLLVVITILFFCLYLAHGVTERIELRRQHLAEMIVEKVDGLVHENMGEYFKSYAPFVIAIMALSGFSSLLSLFGLFPPTSDVNVVAGWAILVFIIITYYKLKCGIGYYLKGFLEPVAILAPINLIGEFSTPLSMAFRHYGNVLSGSVVSVLLSAALMGLSSMVMGALPGFLSDIPIFQIGIPAVFSLYFDIFSGCLQAFIFAMLTMLNISLAFPAEDYELRKKKKLAQKAK